MNNPPVQILSKEEQKEFLKMHFSHRLTLLRTFRDRQIWFSERAKNGEQDGDLFRCAKDSALMAARLFAEFLGFQPDRTNPAKLQDKRGPKGGLPDIRITHFGLPFPNKHQVLSQTEVHLLLGVLNRADKEFAHLTSVFNDEFNTAEKLIAAIDLLERLLETQLYGPLGFSLPTLERGMEDPSDGKYQFAEKRESTCQR